MAVTLGGGITMTYGSCGESARGVNTPRSSHRWYSRRSTSCGLYWGGNANRGSGIHYYRQDGERRGTTGKVGEPTGSPSFPVLPRRSRIRSHARRVSGAPHEPHRPLARDWAPHSPSGRALLPRRAAPPAPDGASRGRPGPPPSGCFASVPAGDRLADSLT